MYVFFDINADYGHCKVNDLGCQAKRSGEISHEKYNSVVL